VSITTIDVSNGWTQKILVEADDETTNFKTKKKMLLCIEYLGGHLEISVYAHSADAKIKNVFRVEVPF
jgi:hypothetical protein